MRDAVDEVSWNSTPYGPRAPSISPPLKCDRELSSRPWYPSAPKAFFFSMCSFLLGETPTFYTWNNVRKNPQGNMEAKQLFRMIQ